MTLKLCPMSESVIRNGETNMISIIEILEGIESSSFPVFFPKLTSYWLLEKEDVDKDEYDGELIFSIGGKELHRFPVGINFQGMNLARNIIGLGGF